MRDANFPDYADGRVLSQLALSGIDLSHLHTIEYHVAAPDRDSATAIAKSVSAAGYTNELYYDKGEPDANGYIDQNDREFGPSWTIYVRVTSVPTHSGIFRIQKQLDEMSKPHGGFSDGWGLLYNGTQ